MIRWLFSKTLREAAAMRNHVRRLLNAQRDLMTPAALQVVQGALQELQRAINDPRGKKELRAQMAKLEQVAGKWLRPYPHAAWRENVEVLLVALAVAMGIRTFFLQPFKIPTGSMQPTLYGVTSTPDFTEAVTLADDAARFGGLPPGEKNKLDTAIRKLNQAQQDLVIPTGWKRIVEWFEGTSYLHVVAQADGTIDPDAISPMRKFLIFNIRQSFMIGGVQQTIWFPPDFGESDLRHRAGWFAGRVFKKGQDVVKMRINAGDHLFVDRLTYNFRKPQRGEIVVFETAGIPAEARAINHIPADEFYIKRLMGLGDETISLRQDYELEGGPHIFDAGRITPVGHLVVNGQPLSASTPRFENLYSFPGVPAGTKIIQFQANHYYGHAMIQALSPGREFQIRPNHLFVMGDNTMNSLDSRFWGDFSESYVIGKSFFVYWPLTKRFGIAPSVTAQ